MENCLQWRIGVHGVHLQPPPHRVGRVLSISPVVETGTPPTPHPQARVPPPPPLVPGGVAPLAGKRGVGESQFRRGDTYCGTLYKYVLFAPLYQSKAEPVFVNLLRSPGIDSQPLGSVRQPYLSYRPAWLQELHGRIYSPESIPGLYKLLQIRVLILLPMTKGTGGGVIG
jgi:hypothetical protein